MQLAVRIAITVDFKTNVPLEEKEHNAFWGERTPCRKTAKIKTASLSRVALLLSSSADRSLLETDSD